MPRAPKRCAHCRNVQPCKTHGVWKGREMPSGWAKIRKGILARDGGRCTRCGSPATSVDHIRPHSQGGTEDPGNLTSLCDVCHQAKSNIEKNWRHRR